MADAAAATSKETDSSIERGSVSSLPLDRHRNFLFLLFLPLGLILVLLPAHLALALVLGSVVYYTFLLAALVSEIAIRPPWYRPSSNPNGRRSLTMQADQIPSYWEGVFHDPLYDFGLQFEDVSFRAHDGRTMRGWLVPAHGAGGGGVAGTPAVLCVHGGGRDRRAFLRHLPLFHGLGCSTLLFDFLEHGASDGTGAGFTYGAREQFDVLAAVHFLRGERGCGPVVLVGTSIGASSAILAAAQAARLAAPGPARLPRPLAALLAASGRRGEELRVAGVVAENPLARPEELVRGHLERLLHPYMPRHRPAFRLLFAALAARLLLLRIRAVPWHAPWRAGGCGAVDAVRRIGCPLLVMHGTADEIVPPGDSERIFARAAAPKQLWLAPDATHCALFNKYREEYAARIAAFLRPLLPPRPPPAPAPCSPE